MEKMAWPPPGSMGPIFGEYLFIRFFTRPGEETKDQRFWSPAKFQELLMQLRYNVIPNDSLITKGYPIIQFVYFTRLKIILLDPYM